MVVRDYLVENFGFDDTQLKTLGMGKQPSTQTDAPWGTVRILIYPAGTLIPQGKHPQPVVSSARPSDKAPTTSTFATPTP
jgi:hypothetical protein